MGTKRILIFNVNWLGDVLFSTATIRNIRYNFPDSFISCIVPQRCAAILEGNPHLDQIISFDEKHTHKSITSKIAFIRQLKTAAFDTVFLLHRSMSRALITWLAAIPERIGYYTPKRGFLLTKKIPIPDPESLHRIDYYLAIIERAGLEVRDRFTEIFPQPEDEKKADDFLSQSSLRQNDFLVGINAGGNWGPKRWPKEYFAQTADLLIRECNAKVIITGSSQDIALAEEIQSLMKGRAVMAAGTLDLKQFACLCKRFSLFISSDTGPVHIANAVGTKKIIALFGPTSVRVTGPYPAYNVTILQKPTECTIPCYNLDCQDNLCMKAIKPEDVLAEAKKIRGI